MTFKTTENSDSLPSFTVRHKVRFQHCDPAKIVFYPRYYEMLNASIEDFFEEITGVSHREMCEQGMGIPMVHLALDFINTSQLGDQLCFIITPIKIGKSSVRLQFAVESDTDRELKVEGKGVIAFADIARKCSIPIPDQIKQRLLDFQNH